MSTSPESNVVFISFMEGNEEEKTDKLRKYFRNDAANWASFRAHEFGELILPKFACITLSGQIKEGQPTSAHSTYYVEHSGTLFTDTYLKYIILLQKSGLELL
jgi:hypothetical protein